MNASLVLLALTGLSSPGATHRPTTDGAPPLELRRYDFATARALLSGRRAGGSPGPETPRPALGAPRYAGVPLGPDSDAAGCAATRSLEAALVRGRGVWPRLPFSERSEVPASWRFRGAGVLASAAEVQMLALGALATVLPTEYVVDDDGGPGVDFLEIADAVAVAVAGDLISVRPGNYQEFTLTQGVTILGPGAVGCTSSCARVEGTGMALSDLPAGEVAIVAGLACADWLIEDCLGTVVLDDVSSDDHTEVVDSADVRLHDSTIDGSPVDYLGDVALGVRGSRVEVCGCTIVGGAGAGSCGYYGGNAMRVTQFGRAHVVETELEGGPGGYAECYSGGCFFSPYHGGDGGFGLSLNNSYVISSGAYEASTSFTGGPGGDGKNCGPGADGRAASVAGGGTSVLRHSNVQIGTPPNVPDIVLEGPQSMAIAPALPDPVLLSTGEPKPGSWVRFEVYGAPGGATQLYLSRTPTVEGPPGDGVVGTLVPFDLGIDLGVMPARGVATHDLWIPRVPRRDQPLPEAWLFPATVPVVGRFFRGDVLFAQATVLTDGAVRRTNSVPIVIR